jgi:hypothetical protein
MFFSMINEGFKILEVPLFCPAQYGRLHLAYLTYSKIQKLPYPGAENHFPEPYEFLEERLDIYILEVGMVFVWSNLCFEITKARSGRFSIGLFSETATEHVDAYYQVNHPHKLIIFKNGVYRLTEIVWFFDCEYNDDKSLDFA